MHARARAVRSLLHMDIAGGAGDDSDYHAPPHTPQIPTLGNLSYLYSKLYIYLFIYLFIFLKKSMIDHTYINGRIFYISTFQVRFHHRKINNGSFTLF